MNEYDTNRIYDTVKNIGYFKTNDEVDLVIVRGQNFIETKLKLIDPYNKKGYKK